MRQVFLLLSALTVLGTPRPAAAQAPLKPGSRVRFDANSLGVRLAGTLVAWESDTLVVRVDGEPEGLGLIVLLTRSRGSTSGASGG